MLVLLLTISSPVLADSAPMLAVGPNLQPMESTTVRLESERIDIRLHADERTPLILSDAAADYRIQFHFVPTADESLTLGFPLFVIDQANRIDGAHIQDFRVQTGGNELPTETKTALYQGINTEWATFPVSFQSGKPLDLEITYRMPVAPAGKFWDADLWLGYVIRTGAYWAGTIGKAEANLTVDRPLRPEDIRTTGRPGAPGTTPGWVLQNGGLHWEWQEVEPDFDLSVQVANIYWLDMPTEIRKLLGQAYPDRDTLLRAYAGIEPLIRGNERADSWPPVREGSSKQVGLLLLKDAVARTAEYIDRYPADWEIRRQYLYLVGRAWSVQWDENLFNTWLTASLRYRTDGGPASNTSPESVPAAMLQQQKVRLTDASQANAAAFLTAVMPPRFMNEAAARKWVEDNTGTGPEPILAARYTQPLMTEALKRVVAYTPPAPDPAGSAPAAPQPAAEPTPAAPASAPAPQNGWL
ncbi:MAG: hypothetical protein ACM3XM_20770, partial [Mycobacterium leprae]